MIKLAKTYLIILIVAVCLWQLPWFINFLTVKADNRPFVLYSSVINDFAMRKNVDGKSIFYDLNGNEYTKEQFDRLLPEYYARQLAADNSLSDTLFGQAVSLKLLTDENLSMRIKPEMIFGPQYPLYQMLESLSGRVDLEMPEDVFRISDTKIEFINKADNTINYEKSKIFTDELKKHGFDFPVREVAANSSDHKKYDNGFLLTDNDGTLFNLKMEKGKPIIRKIDIPNNVIPEHCFVTEFPGKHSLGVFFDSENNFYVITLPYYKVIKTELPPVDLENDEILVMGNMFTWTIRVNNTKQSTWYAVDSKEFKLLKTYNLPMENRQLGGLSFLKHGWINPNWK